MHPTISHIIQDVFGVGMARLQFFKTKKVGVPTLYIHEKANCNL